MEMGKIYLDAMEFFLNVLLNSEKSLSKIFHHQFAEFNEFLFHLGKTPMSFFRTFGTQRVFILYGINH